MKIITSPQIRMARAYLNWSVEDLAKAAGVGSATVKRMEKGFGVPSTARVETLEAIHKALSHGLEEHGAKLVYDDDGTGVWQASSADH